MIAITLPKLPPSNIQASPENMALEHVEQIPIDFWVTSSTTHIFTDAAHILLYLANVNVSLVKILLKLRNPNRLIVETKFLNIFEPVVHII